MPVEWVRGDVSEGESVMKGTVRNSCVAVLIGPVVMGVYLLSLFVGRTRAVEMVGPSVTRVSAAALRWFLVPRLGGAQEFGEFWPRMRRKLWLWRPLFDVAAEEATEDTVALKLTNCPFCEVLQATGMGDLGMYVCEGDWVVARDNTGAWTFRRDHQIGTGDRFCDHTYSRIRTGSVD